MNSQSQISLSDRIIVISLFALAISVLTVFLTSPNSCNAEGQQNAPLTIAQIEALIRARAPDVAIAQEIQNRGLAFTCTAQIIENLKSIGAEPQTLNALADASKQIPQPHASDEFLAAYTDAVNESVRNKLREEELPFWNIQRQGSTTFAVEGIVADRLQDYRRVLENLLQLLGEWDLSISGTRATASMRPVFIERLRALDTCIGYEKNDLDAAVRCNKNLDRTDPVLRANADNQLFRIKQKSTMVHMRAIGTAVEAYAVDYNEYPSGSGLAAIAYKLEPKYVKKVALMDGWGNEFIYVTNPKEHAQEYWIISYGADGKADPGLYLGDGRPTGAGFGATRQPNDDIIFGNGSFDRYPEGQHLH